MPGISDRFQVGVPNEQEQAIKALFPASNKFQMLQMIGDLQHKVRVPMSVLGVIRRRFKSEILTFFQEEYNIEGIPIERKGRLELSEIVAFRRQGPEKED